MTHLYLFVLVHGIGVIHYENFSYFSTLNLVNVHLHELDERCTLINSETNHAGNKILRSLGFKERRSFFE